MARKQTAGAFDMTGLDVSPETMEKLVSVDIEDWKKEADSIGEFYEEIRRGFVYLHQQHGASLFCGDPKRQVGPEYYYSGGGEVHVVTDMQSATAAIELDLDAPIAPPVRAIADRALGGRAMAVAA